jgi:hypothetical protein
MLDRNNLDWPRMLVSPHDGGLLVERLFMLGYGFSAVPAVLMAVAGAGLLKSLLIFWFGGVAGVLAASLILARPKRADALVGLTTTDREQAQEADGLY